MPNKLNIKKYSKKKNKVKRTKIMYGGLKCDNPSNKAYMMCGHGGTTSMILDVPDGCVYITTTLCGTSSPSSFMNNFFVLFKNSPDTVKNPCDVNNFNRINQVFSRNSEASYYIGNTKTNDTIGNPENTNYLNMHISKKTCETSATCPKKYLFQYKDSLYIPCAYWFFNNNVLLEKMGKTPPAHDSIICEISGLISSDNSFEEMKRIKIENYPNSEWTYPMIRDSHIQEIYKYSMYPGIDDILAKIRELNIQKQSYLKITDPTDRKYIDINSTNQFTRRYYDSFIMSGYDFIKMIKQHFSITQSELFKRFSGVHYNTLCRPFNLLVGWNGEHEENPFYSKKFQRQSSVDNRENLLQLYDEESGASPAATHSDTNSSCKKCNTPVAAAAAAAAGIACCLGSMGASVPATATAAAAAATLGAYSAPKIQKMIKREGGKKNKNKTKNKRSYKTKNKRSYKTKTKKLLK